MALYCLGARIGKKQPKYAVDPLPPMPTEDPARTTEAVGRALPDLLRPTATSAVPQRAESARSVAS
jgi:hypothetical protein